MTQPKFGLRPTILLLKDSTDTSQGKGQLLTNIRACVAISDVLQTTLGPRGMDKLIVSKGKPTVSNDGATIITLLDIVHPAARCLVDIAKSQDSEIGDGTTSVVVLTGSILKSCIPLVEANVHPRLIIRVLSEALSMCIEKIRQIEINMPEYIPGNTGLNNELRQKLETLAATAMNSKLIAPCKEQFSKMTVDAVMSLIDDGQDQTSNKQILDANTLIGVKKVLGGALQDSQLVYGVAFKKTFTYAGHEQLPKCITNPVICCLNFELEWQAEKDNAEIRLTDPEKFKDIVNAEYKIILGKLEKIVTAGATVVLSNKSIGDLATQYFADHKVFCAGRVLDEDMKRISTCSSARIISAVSDLTDSVLGKKCGLFEEKQIGVERFNYFTKFEHVNTCTFILRGGADQFIQESERSLHDAICVVRRAIKHPRFIAGGGSIEMFLSAMLYRHAKTISGKNQLIFEAIAKALEAIPFSLCENAGFDSTYILAQLRSMHAQAIKQGTVCWHGVDINNDMKTIDCMAAMVWEPSLIRINALQASFEAARTILGIDQTIVLKSSAQDVNAGRSQTADMKQRLADAGMGGAIAGQGMKMFQGHGGK